MGGDLPREEDLLREDVLQREDDHQHEDDQHQRGEDDQLVEEDQQGDDYQQEEVDRYKDFVFKMTTTICYDEWWCDRSSVSGTLRGLGLDFDENHLKTVLDSYETQGLPMADLAEVAVAAGLFPQDELGWIRRAGRNLRAG